MTDYYGNNVDCDDDILTYKDEQLLAVRKRAEELNLKVSIDDSGWIVLKKENGDIYAEYSSILNAYSNTRSGNLS